MSMGEIPDSKAVTGEELPAEAISSLLESGIIREGEKIQYYYSEGLMSFVDFGNLFTNSRVISYEVDADTDKKNIYSAVYSKITDIQFTKSENIIEDSVIEIHVKNQPGFILFISPEEGRDQLFYQKLVETWNANRGTDSAGENI